MVLPFFSPLSCFSGIAGPEGAKNPAWESPPPDSDPFNDVHFWKNLVNLSRQFGASANCQFQFYKRSQHLIRVYDETLPVALASAIQIALLSESAAETQPTLQPPLLEVVSAQS